VTASLAAERASVSEVGSLRELVDRSRSAVEDPVAFTNLAVRFHQALADMSHNRALRASLGALRSTQLEHLGPPTTRPIAERVSSIHSAIVEAIAARDPGLARDRMRDHLAAVSHQQAVDS